VPQVMGSGFFCYMLHLFTEAERQIVCINPLMVESHKKAKTPKTIDCSIIVRGSWYSLAETRRFELPIPFWGMLP
jgi:hypothetical protein